MYNPYNLRLEQSFLNNYRKTPRLGKLAEMGTMFLLFAASFVWLWL